MALDLNIPPTEDEEDPPPLAGARPMGHASGQPFDLDMATQETMDGVNAPTAASNFDVEVVDGFNAPTTASNFDLKEVYGFTAPTAASNFDLNFDLEEEEADEDADVYAEDFHVVFAEEEVQGSSNEKKEEKMVIRSLI